MHPDAALVPNPGLAPVTASFPQSKQLILQSKLDKWLRFVKNHSPASRSAFLTGIAASTSHRTASISTVFLDNVARIPNPGPAPDTAIFPQTNQLNLQTKLDKWVRFVKNHCPASCSAFLEGIAASTCHRTAGIFAVHLENVARGPSPGPAPDTAIFPHSNQLILQAKLNKWFRFVKNRSAPSRTSFLTGKGRG